MIYVYDLFCRDGSHESCNSGFIYGLKNISDVTFFADRTHIQAIKEYFQLRNVDVPYNLTFKKINVPKYKNIKFYFIYNRFLRFILDEIVEKNENKLLFLTSNPFLLHMLLNLSRTRKYKKIIFNIVLHGELEQLVSKPSNNYSKKITPEKKDRQVTLQKVLRIIKRCITGHYLIMFLRSLDKISDSIFERITKILIGDLKTFFSQKNNLSAFNFIVLSKYIYENLPKYIKNSTVKMNWVYLPCIFPKWISRVENKYPKFAIFGYGSDNGLFEQLLSELAFLSPSKKYEIRLISMRNYDTHQYKNVTSIGGEFIPREKMEKYAEDIDYFLNFYDKEDYMVSCSGSIVEAIMLKKPVIYLGNDCYDSFNALMGPIGIKTRNINLFAKMVFDIIENWPCNIKNIMEFKKNIKDVQNLIDIRNRLRSDSNIIA
jgi:hypothetical protein